MRAAVVLALAVVACGRGAPTAPDLAPTPEPFPAWRLDRSDTLNWMLGHRPAGLWLDSAVAGHGMIPVLEGTQASGTFWWVKLRTGDNYERYEYDPAFIYFREDHATDAQARTYASWGGSGWKAYTWTDVRWMPRRLPAPGQSIGNTENRMLGWDLGCNVVASSRYPIYTEFVGFETTPEWGDTIHMRFFTASPKLSENYWYSWEWGWVRWTTERLSGGILYDSRFTRPVQGSEPLPEPSCFR